MSCYHPLKAFYRVDDNGKKDIVFASSSFEAERDFVFRGNKVYSNKIDIPCGQCIGCRLDYSRQWAVRCVLEAKQYPCNYFLTLTYDNEHLPSSRHCKYDLETGEVVSDEIVHSLVPEHLTKFMKDLRRYFEYHFNFQGIRFFGCGEYGDKNGRPHYHLLLFNCPIPDLKVSKLTSHSGCDFFESDIISDIWQNGLVGIGEVTFQSCAYTARYIMKKHKGKDSSFYHENGLVAEFTRMSRKPGIARSYFDENCGKIYHYDSITLSDYNGKPLIVKPPRYYDKIFDLVDPDEMARIKTSRQDFVKNQKRSLLKKTSLSYDDYLTKCEDIKISKLNTLAREI